MAKSKKVLSLALAVVMAISMLSIGAFAAKTTPAATITVSATTADGNPVSGPLQNGDAVTVTVAAKADADYFVGPTSVPVTYNPAYFAVSNVTATNLFGEGTTEVVTNIDKEAGKLTVVITPLTTGEPQATNLNNNGQNVVLYTFTLTAIADSGTCDVAVVNDQKATNNLTGKLYITSFDGPDARTAELTEVGQTLNGLDTAKVTLTIGSAEPELILTATGESYGTIIRNDLCTTNYAGCVFGIDTLNGEAIEKYVTAVNGSIEVVPNEGSGKYATGATIVLKDNAGVPVKTYVFIYFGDVNGDGRVDSTDSVAVEKHDGWIQTIDEDTAYFYAADVNYDGRVDSTDSVAIEKHDGWITMLDDQNVIAAGINSKW